MSHPRIIVTEANGLYYAQDKNRIMSAEVGATREEAYRALRAKMPQATMQRIHRDTLLSALGLLCRIPADACLPLRSVDLPEGWGFPAQTVEACCLKANGKYRQHRILVKCPACGALVPAGRANQHRCK